MIQILVMGVCGVGKSSLAQSIAQRIQARFIEGDDFHSRDNIERMKKGEALDDMSREPWLDAISLDLKRSVMNSESAVISCSALRQKYRDRIFRYCPNPKVISLVGQKHLIRDRLRARIGHFADERLLDSQLQILEEPRDGIKIQILESSSVDSVTKLALDALIADGALAESEAWRDL